MSVARISHTRNEKAAAMNTTRSLRVYLPTPFRDVPALMMGHRVAVSGAQRLACMTIAWAARWTTGRPIKPAMRRGLAVALGAAVVFGAVASALAQPAPTPTAEAAAQTLADRYDEAMQDYERNHWPQAFEAFRQLAEQGHGDAARLTMQMHCHGKQLYGQQFALTAVQMARFGWQGRCTKSAPAPAKSEGGV